MPKETIEAEGLVGGEGGAEPRAIVVKWGIDTDVQLATIKPDGAAYDAQSGIYVDVNRGQINKLIKALRKARDQAYGADE